MKKAIILFVCAIAALMVSGCYMENVSFGMGDHLVGEEYPDAEKYQVGAFTYAADDVNYVNVYWRSGEVKIVESDRPQLSVRESGGELAEDIAMHSLLEDGILGIRFCQSGAEVYVNPAEIITSSGNVELTLFEAPNVTVRTSSGNLEIQ